MSYEENATDGGIAKDHKENLQQGNIDTKHKSWAIIKTSTFHSLLAGLFNSWDLEEGDVQEGPAGDTLNRQWSF